MVKANGYGHGAAAIAKILAAEGSNAFGVATLEEGVELRQAGIRTPILVLAGAYPDQIDQFFDNSLTPVIHALASLEELDAIVHRRKKALKVHLKVDTGMGRIGLLAAEVDSWLPKIEKANRPRDRRCLLTFLPRGKRRRQLHPAATANFSARRRASAR